MSKPIEMGIFTSDWGISAQRVGPDAFVALLTSDTRGTRPVVVIRTRAIGEVLIAPDLDNRLGFWTELSRSTYTLAERSPVTIFGGEGPFALTPLRILTADPREASDIGMALGDMMKRSIRFARVVIDSS